MIDDKKDWDYLVSSLKEKDVLIIAPGKTILTHDDDISKYIQENKPIVISLNFVPEKYISNYVFFSNSKRLDQADVTDAKMILTSNIKSGEGDYIINYNRLSGAFTEGCNALILLLNLLKKAGTSNIALAGADGYVEGAENYYDHKLVAHTEHGNKFNIAVKDAIRNLDINVNFITPSAYTRIVK